jgi:hypothetical protein
MLVKGFDDQRTLVHGDATASDGRCVASGVYFFRLQAQGISGANYFGIGKTLILRSQDASFGRETPLLSFGIRAVAGACIVNLMR